MLDGGKTASKSKSHLLFLSHKVWLTLLVTMFMYLGPFEEATL